MKLNIPGRLFAVLACLTLLPPAAESQEMEGRIRYLVVHNWSKKLAAVDYISKQRREREAYIWGSRSEWKMYSEMYFTPTTTLYQESEEHAEPDDDGYSWRKEPFMVRRDFEKNADLEIFTMLGKKYVLQDSIHGQDWKILNDMKEVAGHVCMNAFWEDTVKLQKVSVWFALDIPISSGPERFCGLPGMILEADVNDGALLLTADKIELYPLTGQTAPPAKMKGKKITESEFLDMLKKHVEEKRKAEDPPYYGIRY